MTDLDLPAVQRLADAAHPDLPERPEILCEKLHRFPEGCRVLAPAGAVTGYGFAHPWMLDSIPPLDTPLGALPDRPTCLYLHDIVVAPEARGSGAAAAYVSLLLGLARTRRLAWLALVSVHDTWPMWQRRGFRVVERPGLVAVLQDYGPSARYMVRSVTG